MQVNSIGQAWDRSAAANLWSPAQKQTNYWDTRVVYMDVFDTGNDVMDGGRGDDHIFGQVRGGQFVSSSTFSWSTVCHVFMRVSLRRVQVQLCSWNLTDKSDSKYIVFVNIQQCPHI